MQVLNDMAITESRNDNTASEARLRLFWSAIRRPVVGRARRPCRADDSAGGRHCGTLVRCAGAILLTFAWSAAAQPKITFQQHILPIVEANCSKCHNPDKPKADLDLVTYRAVLKGGGTGPIVQSGNPDDSKLMKVLLHAEEPFMPPNRPKLADPDLDLIRKWIAGGLLENPGGKAVAAAKPAVDLSLKVDATGKPEGPPAMPVEFPLEPSIHTARGNAILSLAGSPWAPILAVAGQKQVLLFHTETLETLGILPFTAGQPAVVAFSRSGRLLLAGGGEAGKSGRVLVWDVVTGERLMMLGDERDTVLAADIRPDQTQVAMGGPSRLVKLVDTRGGDVSHVIKKHTDWVTALAYSPNGQMLATGDRNGGISVWDPDNGLELFTLSEHKGGVTALSWRGDSKVLASASEDGTVKWWELEGGKSVKSWAAHPGGALSVSYTHDGRLVTCGRDGAVTLWKADAAKERAFTFFGNLPLRAAFGHDGQRIVAADFAGRVAAWKVADEKPAGELNANPAPLAAQLLAAEQHLELVRGRRQAAETKLAQAKAGLAQAEAAATAARQALERAAAEQVAREADVVQLKAQATNNAAADLEPRLAAARATRAKAREATANAKPALDAAAAAVTAAQANVAEAKAALPDAALAAAATAVTRIKSHQARTMVFHVRERHAELKRAHDQLAAALAGHQAMLEQGGKDLATARAAAARAEASMAAATAGIQQGEPQVRQAAADLKAEQVRLDEWRQAYDKVKAELAAQP